MIDATNSLEKLYDLGWNHCLEEIIRTIRSMDIFSETGHSWQHRKNTAQFIIREIEKLKKENHAGSDK